MCIGAGPCTHAPSSGACASHGYVSVFGHCSNVNEALYLSTVTRAGGLMLGAAFALIWRPVAIMRGPLRTRGRRIDLLGLLGLLGLALMMNRLELVNELTNEYDPWLFRGGFLLLSLIHISEPTRLLSILYAVFCLKKKNTILFKALYQSH